MKKGLTFFIKCLISILLFLVLVEIGLRVFPGLIPPDLLIFFNETPRAEIARQQELPVKENTTIIERDDGGAELRIYKPFTTVTWSIPESETKISAVMDELGFCNLPENSYQRSTIDIITLGDSFTACHAVEPPDVWPSQLSKLTGLPTYNLGRIGIGLHEYIQLFKKFGLEKSPRIVIMNIYEGNDFRDARNYYEQSIENKHVHLESESSNFPGVDLLECRSYAVNLFLALGKYVIDFYSAETSRINVDFRYQLVFSDEVSIPFNPENVDTDEVRNAMYLTTLQTDDEVFQAIEAALRTFVELSKQYDFMPIVTYTPSAYTAYSKYVVFDDPKLNGLMLSFSYEQRQYLDAKGKELGYVFIDLTPTLQAVAQSNGPEELLYYQHDLHLTPAGHTAVANALHQSLQDLDILKK